MVFSIKPGNKIPEHAVENTDFTSAKKKAFMSRSQFKITLVCFFHHKGTVHYEFTAQEKKKTPWFLVRKRTTNNKSTALFGNADKVRAICSGEQTETLA
jgi:hypothetical protein